MLDNDLPMFKRIETPFDAQATNIAEALKLAQATSRKTPRRRTVASSPTRQETRTRANVMEQAQAVAAARSSGMEIADPLTAARRKWPWIA